jgi:hypothetical protein
MIAISSPPLALEEPAAGAPIEDLVIGGIVTALMVGVLIVFGAAHRAGRTKILKRLGDISSRVTGMPSWVGVPAAITGVSLLVAVFGFYWDVSIHIDSGRDPGPFANVSHYLIIFGLAGIALAGFVSILLGTTDADPSLIRLPTGWRAPIGGLLLFVCGGIAVLGFPLDDVWHRLFGQDVTLWSPTHIQMVGGAGLSTLALWVLIVEGRRRAPEAKSAMARYAEPLTAGAFLLGLSALQAEFDFSVPQFRVLYHPILLMLSAGTALVAARLRLGRGGAIKAVLMFLAIRGIVSLLVGPILGHTTLHFPLYIVEALAVEAVAAFFGTENRLKFGLLAGLGIGTFGLGAEWAWSHVWMIAPWKSSLLPEAIILGFVAAVAGSLVGIFIAQALSAKERAPLSFPRPLAFATGAAVIFCLAYPFPTGHAVDATAGISLDRSAGGGTAHMRVDVEPSGIADDAEFFNVTAWQGDGSVVQEPVRVRPGVYEFEDPVPVSGDWKTLIRMQKGDDLMAVPVYLPEDRAIPAPEVPAGASMERRFISDKEIVLREAKDVGPGLVYAGAGVIGAIAILWVLVIGWGLTRLSGSGGSRAGHGVPATA